MGLREHFNRNSGKVLSTVTREDLAAEISRRDNSPNLFPLDVFHPRLRGWIDALVNDYQLPDCYIGLNLLAAYSTAIGTHYAVTANGTDRIYLPCWGCMVGMSSSGKSWIMDMIMKPFEEIQSEFDAEWREKTQREDEDKKVHHRLKTVTYRDSVIATLTRYVLPDNPKGVLKMSDELLEWINGLNAASRGKDGVDEQFWISSWNCKAYRIIRSMKQVYSNPRPFVNVFGGIQYKILPKLFANDRDSTGFVFRLLFARPTQDRIPMADPEAKMPREYEQLHSDCIKTMYHSMWVNQDDDDPKLCILTKEARALWYSWSRDQDRRINAIEDRDERDINAGIFGKIKEYALRFSALLAISDIALNMPYYNGQDKHYNNFPKELPIDTSLMQRALKLADYFIRSAADVYEIVNITQYAPPDVLTTAYLLKQGRSYSQIAEVVWNDASEAGKKRMARSIKKWVTTYPKVFQSYSRN